MDENNNQNNLNNDNTFKNVTTSTNTSFGQFEGNKKKSKSSNSGNGFVKSVVLPFTCGILGAGIVVGTCFGVPSIRSNILGEATTEGSSTVGVLNTQQISLLDYSDTPVGVAQKVLPSIVGINVTYSVNSIFYSG